MTTSFDLLSRGYFPKELPPPFSTLDFASRVLGSVEPVPASMRSPRRTRLWVHNLVRPGGHRRPLGIPNPIVQFCICELIGDNWTRIEKLLSSSPFTLSTPVGSRDRALAPGRGRILAMRARLRARARFIVLADIARFYHSIYTHSIPWAIHGKDVAKKKQGKSGRRLLGNRLDRLLMDCQDGQTMGIPVGPDTSLVLAEIVASGIDRKIRASLRGSRGLRFMDDFEFSCRTRQEAEEILNALHISLQHFELALNSTKTSVVELPFPIDQPWRNALRIAALRDSAREQETDLIALFDQAFYLAKQQPDKNVLAYTVARLGDANICPENAELLQHLLLQCLIAEPGTTAIVLERLSTSHRRGLAVNKDELSSLLNDFIAEHAPLGHSSEVTWSLWGVLAFDITLNKRSTLALSQCTDSAIVLLALHAEARGLTAHAIDKTQWISLLGPDALYGEHWLLAYESSVKGWLTSGIDHVGADANFRWMRDLGVEFYDVSRATAVGGPESEFDAWMAELEAAARSGGEAYGEPDDDPPEESLDAEDEADTDIPF